MINTIPIISHYEIPERLLDAYKLLYDIENYLRDLLINSQLSYHLTYEKLSFFHVITLIDSLPSTKSNFKRDTIANLYHTVKIRNKVCHMHNIDNQEYHVLYACWKELFES